MYYKIIRWLTFLGAIDSLYITLSKYNCAACDTVHNSIWGQPFGIPVALIGFVGYIAIYLAARFDKGKAGLALASGGLAVSIILVITQALILQQFCMYCCISAGIMTLIWLLFWLQSGNWTAGRAVSIIIVLLIAGSYPAFIVPCYSNTETEEQALSVPASSDTSEENDHTLTLYDIDQTPIVIDPYIDNVVFFSSHCDTCDIVLEEITSLSEDKMPYLVDTHIPVDTDLTSEKAAVETKLAKFGLDPGQVLYDLDRLNPVNRIPVWVDHEVSS